MKKIIIIIVFAITGFSVQAQQKNKNAKYDIAVNGNCEQCKKRIEKAAFTVPGVKSANWNIDDHILHLILNEQKNSIIDVKKAVAKAGHDTDEVIATSEDYENLHSCCKYRTK